MHNMMHIITAETMRNFEQGIISAGVDSLLLMERAGKAVADVVFESFPERQVLVIAGTGNNGGDGFIIAEELRARGAEVTVAAVSVSQMKGDAFRAMQLFKGNIISLSQMPLENNPVVVDAILGIGLSKPIEGELSQAINNVNAAGCDVVAVDIPSGIDADTGKVQGTAIRARITVTFGYKKFGHVLLPGRPYCGDVIIADIGLDEQDANPALTAFENSPYNWIARFPWPRAYQHKYDRGHTLVWGGSKYKSGAAKLAALAALRTGSGLVTIICNEDDAMAYAGNTLSLMTAPMSEWQTRLEDPRQNTVAIGPGAGTNETTQKNVLAALAANKRTVLDADALTAFEATPETLFSAIQSPCILTPHAGEFKRLFPAFAELDKITAARRAAKTSGGVVIYKGYDSVIAAPDGRACVNTNALPSLATAGSGDALSGICAGLLAQGMDAFEAACAAVWLHGETARLHGEGLIAEDIITLLPQALRSVKKYGIKRP